MLNKNIVFCFTGKGPLPRSQMTDIAIKAGASVTKSVTNNTTILVIMDMNSQSTKAKKARENGIDLIGPQTFFVMCNIKNNTYTEHKAELEQKIIEEQTKKPLLRKIIL
jgi:BRCT domain type II-containing protein